MTGWSGNRRRRRATVAALTLVGALAVLLALPLTSLGAGSQQPTLGDSLGTLLHEVASSLQATVERLTTPPARSGTAVRASTTAASTPASAPAASTTGYTPPAYGSNPHGQGTVASVSLNPSSTRPYTYASGGSSGQGEEIVIGRGRSEQQPNGTYDAHTTIAALFGTELLGVNATQGESNTGPLNPVQTSILNAICASTSQAICLTVLAADTSATANGANTHFQTAGLTSKQILGLNLNAASADSSISTSGSCQTASGDSQVLGLSANGASIATAATSKESSTACAGQAPSQTASSSVVNLGGTGLALPIVGSAACAAGTPNSPAGIPGLLPIICNADDTTQIVAPFGVREALTILGIQTGSTSLLRVATAASESHAVAPKSPSVCTDTDRDCGSGETCVGGKDPDGDGDCTGNKCTDADHDCGIGAGGKPEKCVGGKDPDGDGDCTSGGPSGGKVCTPGQPSCVCTSSGCRCTDADHDCGKLPSGASEVCVGGKDPDGDGDCVSQVTTLAAKPSAVTAKATLPFTGENVLEVLLAGLILTGGGIAIASTIRRKPSKRRG